MPTEQSEQLVNRSPSQPRQPSAEFLEALKHEMALTAETLNHELTELQVLGYLEALADMSVVRLQAGFKRARRTLLFFPRPAEVRSLASDEIEATTPYRCLREPEPMWTEEERKDFVDNITKTLEKIAKAGGTALHREVKPLTEEEWNYKRDSQLAAVRARYPEAFATK